MMVLIPPRPNAVCGKENLGLASFLVGKDEVIINALWRGTEAVITAPTRNRMVGETRHEGSNPSLSATNSTPAC